MTSDLDSSLNGHTDNIAFYQSGDFNFLIACLPPMGYGGIFRIDLQAETPVWSYVPLESPLWDSIHQNIFRQYRAKVVTVLEQLAALPPVPPVPTVSEPSTERYYLPSKPLQASLFPCLCAELARRNTSETALQITLEEDGYESAFGDGKLLYLKDSIMTPVEPPEPTSSDEPKIDGSYLYYTRYLTVRRTGDTIDFPNFRLGNFEHYEPVEALHRCENRLAAS